MIFPRALLMGTLLLLFGASEGQVFAQMDAGKALRILQKEEFISKDVALQLKSAVKTDSLDKPLEFAKRLKVLEQQHGLKRLSATTFSTVSSRLDKIYPVVNDSRLKHWLENCLEAGLIDQRSLDRLRMQVNNKLVQRRNELIKALTNELHFREETSYQKLLGFAQQLRANGLLADPNGGELISAIDNGDVVDPFEMLDYCSNALRFSAMDDSVSQELVLRKIYRETAALLPELKFDQLVITPLPGSEAAGYEKIHIELKMGDWSYWQLVPKYRPSIAQLLNNNNPSFTGKIDPTSYYELFNLALAEQGALYRLHLVTSGLESAQHNKRFGIIALRKEQLDAFRYLGSYYRFSDENYANALSRDLVKGVIDRYYSFGMFAHLTAQEYRESRELATSNPRMSYEEILACFPGILLNPETAIHGEKKPYSILLKSYSDLSRNVFQASKIVEKSQESDEITALRFACGGKIWEGKIPFNKAAPAPKFIQLVDKATQDVLSQGRFYKLIDSPNWIFLNTEQWDLLHRQKTVGRQK